jgi:formylglycine-generating enzyme required for sulfatase activity
MEQFARLFIPVPGAAVAIAPVDGTAPGYPFAGAGAGTPVTVGDFEISAAEITQGLHAEVRAWANHADREGAQYNIGEIRETSADPFKPVQASWTGAVVWCNAYSEYARANLGDAYRDFEPLYVFNGTVLRSASPVDRPAGLNPAWDNLPAPDPAKKGFRLPTEAEWEFAARGGVPGEDPEAPWNWFFAGHPDDFTGVAVTGAAKDVVGTKFPNTLGIYDMSGNAAELVWEAEDQQRVLRGGSYAENPPVISTRGSVDTGTGGTPRGFRVVRQK